MPKSSYVDLLKDLEHIAEECSKSNWDGYDADPISVGILELARTVVQNLPEDLLDVEIYPSPDGSMNLDWYRGDKAVLLSLLDSSSLGYVVEAYGPTAIGNVAFDCIHLPEWVIKAIRSLPKEES